MRVIDLNQHRRPRCALILGMTLVCVAPGLAQTAPQTLTISGNFIGRASVAPGDPLEFTLSRALLPGEGKLAVMIGQMDVTSVLTETAAGVRYLPSPVALPLGTTEIAVYRITPGDVWQALARFPLRVSASETSTPAPKPPQIQNTVPQPPSSRSTAKPDKTTFQGKPTLTLGLKSQTAETHFPDASRPPRPTFVDYTLQGTLQSGWQHPGVSFQNQFDVVGSSFQTEALRFGLRGKDAPKVDLSNYSMTLRVGRTTLQAGHMPVGTQRQLINAFSSRGVSLTVPVQWVSVTLGALNGTNIVGWDNFFGVSTQDHQIVFGTLGLELIPKRPGGLRVEATLMDGSVQPIQGVNRGVVNDAEKSQGKGVRLVASDKGQRFLLDGGFSRSRFHNPSDPLLAQGQNVVPVREDTANARYVDATWNILQNKAVTKTKTLNLSATYRHEQVDPLYRSLGDAPQADQLQNQGDVTFTLGPVNTQFTHVQSHNNLLNLSGLLTVDTRRNALVLAIPTASLFAKDPSKPSRWLPTISYNLDQIHQVGRGFPSTGFLDLSQVPDQLSTNHIASIEWQLGRSRAAYHLNRSFQDNRQLGRELADLLNTVNGFSVGGAVRKNLDLGYEQSIERAHNVEQQRIDRLYRSGVSLNWRMTKTSVLTARVSGTLAGDVQRTSERRNAEIDGQWAQRLAYFKGNNKKVQAQMFIRYANRYASTVDHLFGVGRLTKIQTLNAGLNITFF